jgi:hypothetical protein
MRELVSNKALLHTLIQERDSSILEYTEGRVYLNPSRLLFSPEDVFIQTDCRGLFRIENLSFDSRSGYFQPVQIRCRNCGAIFDKGPLYCPACGKMV